MDNLAEKVDECPLNRGRYTEGFTLFTDSGVFFFFFLTHFRLSLWMATHLRMCCTTPSVYLDLEKGVLNMIEQNERLEDCGCKSYSSGDFKQQRTSAYNYNVLSVNCGQDWKLSGHCSSSVVSTKNNLLR